MNISKKFFTRQSPRLALIGLLCFSGTTFAKEQIGILDCPATVKAEQSFTCTLKYDTSDASNASTGIGIKLHFDSTKMDFNGINNAFATGNLGTVTAADDDTGNLDGLPATDKFINGAWFDFGGGWPGGTLPQSLYEVQFTLKPGFAVGEKTKLKLSSTDPAVGFDFEAQPLEVELEVAPLNSPPVFTSSDAVSVDENTTSVVSLTVTDDDSAGVTYAITAGGDLFTVDATGQLSFQNAPDFESPDAAATNNVYSVTVTADDGDGGTTDQTIAVTVVNVNEDPTITSAATASIAEDTTAALTLTGTDPENDTLTFTVDSGDDSASFLIVNGNELTFQTPPDFENPADVGGDNIYNVTIKVEDGNGGSSTQNAVITVTDANDPPAVAANLEFTLQTGTTGVTSVTATDPEGDTLSYSISGGADGGSFSIDAASGALTFSAAPDFANPTDTGANNVYEVEVEVTDGNGNTANQTVKITIVERVQIGIFNCVDKARAGRDFTCTVSYDTSDSNTGTTGLGLKIHYDSSKLEFKGFSDVFNTVGTDDSLTAQSSAPVDDSQDLDSDSSTDKYLNTAWFLNSGGWPGAVPVDLFKIEFTLKADAAVDDTTTLKMSAIPAEGEGYGFHHEPHILTAAPSFSWDVDGDGDTTFTSDGILIMRYLFDFRGDTLVNGVISNTATRDADAITAYLDQNRALLDVDADGNERPLTDGLLIVRFLADFRTQDTLLPGAISSTATRTELSDIVDYLGIFED